MEQSQSTLLRLIGDIPSAILIPESMKANRQAPLRIVSLAPSATSILCAIGAKRLLIGVTKWCADIAPVGRLPKLGDCWHMESVEAILHLKPTLVIGSVPYKPETVAKLLDQPLNFLAMNPRTLADIENDIRMLGGIAGRATAAEHLIRKMRARFDTIRKSSLRTRQPVRVYSEAWPNPRIASPLWVAEIVKIAGGEMVVPAGERVSDDQVAEAAPEVIVLAWAATGTKADPKQTYGVASWKNVPAIRNRQVHVIRDELLNTPGPPLVAGAMELAKILRGINRKPSESG
jgi:iron complex transport system substrate-binding protein